MASHREMLTSVCSSWCTHRLYSHVWNQQHSNTLFWFHTIPSDCFRSRWLHRISPVKLFTRRHKIALWFAAKKVVCHLRICFSPSCGEPMEWICRACVCGLLLKTWTLEVRTTKVDILVKNDQKSLLDSILATNFQWMDLFCRLCFLTAGAFVLQRTQTRKRTVWESSAAISNETKLTLSFSCVLVGRRRPPKFEKFDPSVTAPAVAPV